MLCFGTSGVTDIDDLSFGYLILWWSYVLLFLGIPDQEDSSFGYLMSLDILFGTTSILCLTAISMERMYAVRYPADHYNLKDKPVYGVIAGTWVIGMVFTFIKFGFPVGSRDKVYAVLILVFDFLVPLLVIVVCYAFILQTARTMMIPSNQEKNISLEMKVTKTISVIIGLFVFSWLPFFVLNMIIYFCDTKRRYCSYFSEKYWPVYASKALHYSNSMMNFFVYAVRSPDFRQTFKSLLLQRCNHIIIRERLRSLSNDKKKTFLVPPDINGCGGNVTKCLTPNDSDYSMSTLISECPTGNAEDVEKKLRS